MTSIASPESEKPDGDAGIRRLLLQNTAFLAFAQVVGLPLSFLTTALTARYLGPIGLGYIYIATTFNAFGFMAVDWGQGGALPALVASDRTQAGRLLGTALVWRGTTAVAVSCALFVASYFLGYNSDILIALSLVSIGYSLSELSNGCQYVIFGFERTDVAARRQIVEQVLSLAVAAPILVLGGNLTTMLVGSAAVTAVVLAYVWRTLRSAGVGPLSFDLATLTSLLKRGTPFVFVSLAMVLQPYVDTLFLSKMAPGSVGWHAAARKLLGVLVFPAAALNGALYPTLCRLHATDRDGFKRTAIDALRATTLLVVPVALGCLLFPEIGIAVYSRRSFGPAEDNLRVLALFLLLLYFSMPIGNCLLAAGRQRAWAIVQLLCVGVSCVLDPLLIPWFDHRSGNGSLAVCWTAVISEALVIIVGVLLAPRGIFNRGVARSFLSATLSGLAMAAVARALRHFSPFVVVRPSR